VEVLARLHEQGVAVPSATRLRGRFALRVAITNHRSRREDFDARVDAVLRLGRRTAALGCGLSALGQSGQRKTSA
jgi:aromatic-L-amino-acid/L-tryptophan decarboxylase